MKLLFSRKSISHHIPRHSITLLRMSARVKNLPFPLVPDALISITRQKCTCWHTQSQIKVKMLRNVLVQHEGVQGQTEPTNRNPLHILPVFLWGLHIFKGLFLCFLWKAAISSKAVRRVLPSILEHPATGFHAEMGSRM